MYLFELANNPYPFKIWRSSDDLDTYKFITKDRITYTVSISFNGAYEKWIEIDFAASVSPTYSTLKATGTGDAYRVFSTVNAILQEFFKSYPFTHNKFKFIEMRADTDEPSRIKLYDRMLTRLQIPGYTFDGSHYAGQYVEYRWNPT